jgi:hypothetical protein
MVANCGQDAYYLRNEATGANWVGLKLIGRKSNRSAIGARVQVVSSSGQAQWAMVTSAGSYLSSHDRRIVFGFGREKPVKAEIRWPSGRIQTAMKLATGRYNEITEPE